MPDLHIAPGVSIPEEALTFRAVRAGGPGGQHVNKVSSKVEVRVNLDAIAGLHPAARERLVVLAGFRLVNDDTLVITSSESRHQFANKQLVQEKLVELIARSLVAPRVRTATRPTRGSKERRLDTKKAISEKKRGRRPGHDD